MKKIVAMAMSCVLMALLTVPAWAAEGEFTDLPAEGWARDAILAADAQGLMGGMGDGTFGVGRTMSRGEFVTVLSRMFGLTASGAADAFSDISGSWARDAINACAQVGVFGAADGGERFSPDQPITRREMAVWLVRALGLGGVAERGQDLSLPFTDVGADRGYIAVAYDIGMTTGVGPNTFAPEATATREQVAAMLTRINGKYTAPTAFTHAFYAISSYSQLELAKTFDAVSLGWSRMELTDGGVRLNTTTDNGNVYAVPAGYEEAVTALRDAGVKLHLSVYMDTSGGLNDLLADPALRTAAVDAIMAELTVPYRQLGDNPYTGVTIDFEGLRAARREDYTSFLRELRARLAGEGLTLYGAVMPATADGVYYDGYDFRAIGELADKVILMAHDFSPRSMEGFVGTTYHRTAALTPVDAVYYALRTACDPHTGVGDPGKLVQAVSCTGTAWQLDSSGKLADSTPFHPDMATIYRRLTGGGEMGWSETYHNPYLEYDDGQGGRIFLWYEDQRSVGEKAALAKLFGMGGVSLWRLGNIPNYPDSGLYFDVMAGIR